MSIVEQFIWVNLYFLDLIKLSTDFQTPDDGFSWPERMGLEEMISAIRRWPLDKSKYLSELKGTKGFVSYLYHILIEYRNNAHPILKKDYLKKN